MNPQEKRTGSTFTSIYEDGSVYKYKNVIEYEDRIILVDSISSVFFKVIWKNYPRVSSEEVLSGVYHIVLEKK